MCSRKCAELITVRNQILTGRQGVSDCAVLERMLASPDFLWREGFILTTGARAARCTIASLHQPAFLKGTTHAQ